MFIAETLLIAVIVLWIYFLWSRRKYYAMALKMPGPIGLPIIGIGHKIMNANDLLYNFYELTFKYTKTYFSWFGPLPMVYTMEPKIAEIFLTSPHCLDKAMIYKALDESVGHGLLSLKTHDWIKRRKLLNPSFGHKVLLNFFPNFNQFSRELCEIVHKEVDSGEVDIKDLLFNLSLKSAVASTMGLDFKQKSDLTFLDYFERAVVITVYRSMRPWFYINSIFMFSKLYKPFKEANTIIKNFITELIMKRMKIFEASMENNNKINSKKDSVNIEKTKDIFIDQAISIHHRNEITFKDIGEESKLMVFAAFDTTGTTMFSILMCLAMFPQYQEKVYEEIISVFPENDFDIKYEDLKNLPYLDMCINETMRVVATIPIIARECIEDIPISKDVVVPKGTQIAIDIFHMHRDETIWGPNANVFDPDHFLPANFAQIPKYAYMPYSKGPRHCIGWQYAGMFLKVSMVHILRKFRFSTKFRFEDLRFVQNVTVRFDTMPHIVTERR